MTNRPLPITASLMILLMIIALGGEVRAVETPVTPANLANVLNSSNDTERVQACETLITTYNESTDEQRRAIRNRYAEAILSVLNSQISDREDWMGPATPRNLAVRLAGALKIISAIPRLIELLRPLDGERIKPSYENLLVADITDGGQSVAPSAKALILIGDDAKPAVVAAQAQTHDSLVDSSIVKGSKEYQYRVRKALNIKYVMQSWRNTSPGGTAR